MNAEIKEISESDYNKLKHPILFEGKLADRIFGVISNGTNEYKFSWQSTVIKPKIIGIDDFRCSIGIDLVFVIFEFLTGKILLQLSLDYFFYDSKIYNGFLYVITELEIIKINTKDLLVVETFALPDYFESIEFNEEIILVKCVGDEIVNIK
ncbi:hypothetical protein [Algoriphagus sp. Y33]|uniref:hypothetical protein n=1 Tax=Algoriphagus sp. Y33 TaxID=2772483 RepID=UPI00178730FB|nr:hypothetical protein [Algoriphagus sp. Y33]